MAESTLTNINQSRVKLFRKCRQAHHFRYVREIVPKRRKIALERGTIMHEMIAANSEGKSWEEVLANYTEKFNKLFAEEKVELGDLPTDLKRLMKGYLKHWEGDDLTYVATELEVGPIKLTETTAFKGKIDGIVRDSSGRLWLMEHKTHKKFPKEQVRMQDIQTLIYVWALRKMGYDVQGIIWDYIRTKTPAEPELLKSGQLSKRKNIDTTVGTYLRAIKKHGLDKADYADILEDLRNNEDSWFRRVYVPVQESMIPEILRDYKITSLEILALQHTPIRNLTRDCGWCDYFSICSAQVRGFDADYIMKADFKPAEDHYVNIRDGEEDGEDESED